MMTEKLEILLREMLAELRVIRRLLESEADIDGLACPHCGGAELQDTSVGTLNRRTCLRIGCGRSFKVEAA